MVSYLKQVTFTKQKLTRGRPYFESANAVLIGRAMLTMLTLNGCKTVPNTPATTQTISTQTPSSMQSLPPAQTAATVTQAPIDSIDDEDGENDYPIEPYIPPEPEAVIEPAIQEAPIATPSAPVYTPPEIVIITPPRNDNVISKPPSAPSHNDLLEQARRNSQQRATQATTNNSTLPAFRNLMQVGVNQLKAGQLTNAESSFTRAQRLAPKSSAVYFYLAQVALKKQQPRKAEAMARRGLTVSRDTNRRRALWQIILRSGQAQGNTRVINEARQALR